jgi:hypothetical protein
MTAESKRARLEHFACLRTSTDEGERTSREAEVVEIVEKVKIRPSDVRPETSRIQVTLLTPIKKNEENHKICTTGGDFLNKQKLKTPPPHFSQS